MRIVLTVGQRDALMLPVSGQGGWQSLLHKLQRQVSGTSLTLEPRDVSRLDRYVTKYGQGGWQNRLAFWTDRSVPNAA